MRSLLVAVVIGLLANVGHASLMVEGTVTPQVGSFLYEFTITNTGPDDFVIVSITDAPVADPLIDATLQVPVGFLGSYDFGIGIVDFIGDTSLFAVGTAISGFSFQSLSGPSSGFVTAFEAISSSGNFTSGEIALRVISTDPVVPEPASVITWALLGLTISGGYWWRRKK